MVSYRYNKRYFIDYLGVEENKLAGRLWMLGDYCGRVGFIYGSGVFFWGDFIYSLGMIFYSNSVLFKIKYRYILNIIDYLSIN